MPAATSKPNNGDNSRVNFATCGTSAGLERLRSAVQRHHNGALRPAVRQGRAFGKNWNKAADLALGGWRLTAINTMATRRSGESHLQPGVDVPGKRFADLPARTSPAIPCCPKASARGSLVESGHGRCSDGPHPTLRQRGPQHCPRPEFLPDGSRPAQRFQPDGDASSCRSARRHSTC